ncbi:MAG: ankyrin repeat domain-containing protein [Bdellovibrionales bacterium]
MVALIMLFTLSNSEAFLWASNSLLIRAAKKGNVSEVKKLLAEGADVNARDSDGRTALLATMLSVAKGTPEEQLQIINILLAAGADVNVRGNDFGKTALMRSVDPWSLGSGNTRIINVLIVAGADLNARSNWGKTALMYAASNYLKAVNVLIAAGADVNAKDNDGKTALMYAAGSWANGNIRIVNALLAAGADVNAKDNKGRTYLDY